MVYRATGTKLNVSKKMHVIDLTDKCKELEKKAKVIEKENPIEAIDLYKQSAECFDEHESPKNKNSNLEKAAKLYRGLGKSTEDPTVALDHYEDSSAIYTEIGKEGDAEKVMQEAYQKFIDAAKSLSAEARKMDIPDVAEQQFKLAAGYAFLGMDEKLSKKCWTECADQFYKEAKTIENPREAFEIFKHAILNYNKGKAEGKIDLLLTDAAEKFTKKASEIYKTKKTLVLAIGNFLQAENIYRFINSEQRLQDSDQKIQEICERIGMVKDSIIHYLESQGIKAVSFSDLPTPSHKPDKEELSVPTTDVEPLVQDIPADQEPLPSIPKAIPEIKEKTEPEISTKEIPKSIPKLVTNDLVTDDLEVEIQMEPTEETPADELEPEEISSTPVVADTITEVEEHSDPRPVKHGIPGPTVTTETDDPEEEVIIETLVEEIETTETSPTPTTPDVITEVEERSDPRPIKHGIPGPTVKLDIDKPKEVPIVSSPEMPGDDLEESKIDQSSTISPPEVIDEFLDLLEPEVIEREIHDPLPEIAIDKLKEEDESEPIIETQLQEIDVPETEQPAETSPQEVISDIEGEYQPDPIKEAIAESLPTFEPTEVENEVKFESKHAPEEIDKPEMVQQVEITPQEVVTDFVEKQEPEVVEEEITELRATSDPVEAEVKLESKQAHSTESTSEVDDYMKSRFDPDAEHAETIEETTSVDMRTKATNDAQETGNITRLSKSIMKILREQGYLTESTSGPELLQVPEYQILLFIINNHPVPLEEIEEKTDVSSISLALSNLQADGLVEQTNDYRWTVSKIVENS